MTSSDISKIDRLRDEVHSYHVDVITLVEACKPCQATVVRLASDMYGVNGEKETHPGIMGHVDELRRSRRMMLLALRGAWVLLTILLGAVIGAIYGR